MPKLNGERVTLLIQARRRCLGATLSMVDGILLLPVPASKVVIIGGDGRVELARLAAGGRAVWSKRRVDAHFYTSNRTRDRDILNTLRQRGASLPAEIYYDRLMANPRLLERAGAIGTELAERLEEVAKQCAWVDDVLASLKYSLCCEDGSLSLRGE